MHSSSSTNKRKNRSAQSSGCSCKSYLCLIFAALALVCFVLIGGFLHANHENIIKSGSSFNYMSKSLTSAKQYATNLRSSVAMNEVASTITSNNQHSLPLSKQIRRKRYAYAITITKDGFFQDGAAVLAYSIMKYSQNAPYDISFIAFVHPNVTSSRPGLQRLGFHVIEVPIPINVSAIKFDFLREKINKNGCCGSSELIKLTAYRLMQYDRVVHLDADVIFLNVSAFSYFSVFS